MTNDCYLQYEEAVQRVSGERDQLAQQYQEYIEQLQQQGSHLQVQINTLVEERDSYVQRAQVLQAEVEQAKQTQGKL